MTGVQGRRTDTDGTDADGRAQQALRVDVYWGIPLSPGRGAECFHASCVSGGRAESCLWRICALVCSASDHTSLSDGDWRRDTVARRMLSGRFNGDLYVISYFRMLRVSTCSMVRYRRSIDGAQLNL